MKTLTLCLLLALFVGSAFAAESSWPKMQEFDADFVVRTNAEKLEFIKVLYDVKGAATYIFACRGGSDEYLDRLSGRTNINYVGKLVLLR